MRSNAPSRGLKPLSVTIRRSMELTGLGLTKTYELINAGVLKTTWIGQRRLIIYESLENLVLLSEPSPDEAPRRRGRPKKG
jgi:hypothetical protein